MSSYVSYKNIISQLPIARGDIVNVSSDVLRWICVCRENNEKFDASLVIDQILEKVGPEGTVTFPTFCWSFCRGKIFDVKNSPSETGGLSNVALKRSDFKRTRHAIYSFAVAGRDQAELLSLNNVSAFAEDSPFSYFYHRKAKNLVVGIDYKHAFASVHYAEEKIGVPTYRMFKDFTGDYKDESGEVSRKTFRMYVRSDLSVITEISPRFDEILPQKNMYQKQVINGIGFAVLDMHGIGEIMEEDLRSGKCELVYPAPYHK